MCGCKYTKRKKLPCPSLLLAQEDTSETLNCSRMIMYVNINPIIEAPDE